MQFSVFLGECHEGGEKDELVQGVFGHTEPSGTWLLPTMAAAFNYWASRLFDVIALVIGTAGKISRWSSWDNYNFKHFTVLFSCPYPYQIFP
ncbi:MAG: hypothetical protein FWD67_08605 [Betaproteobacteria bacterium]|nr:hypothetical protein [Betaproteobacteria bacterium]